MIDVVLARIAHLVFAALWTGSVVTVALVVLPLAREGAFSTTEPLEAISSRVTWISRVSAAALFLTGGHIAGRNYTFEGLAGSTNGHLVLAMVVLWLVLAALVEIGAARFERGLTTKQLREPARNVTPIFQAGAVVSVALLLVGGALTANAALYF